MLQIISINYSFLGWAKTNFFISNNLIINWKIHVQKHSKNTFHLYSLIFYAILFQLSEVLNSFPVASLLIAFTDYNIGGCLKRIIFYAQRWTQLKSCFWNILFCSARTWENLQPPGYESGLDTMLAPKENLQILAEIF